MKRILLAAVVALSPALASADPIVGMWKTQVDDGSYAHVDIQPCGAAYCGTIVRTFNSDGEYKSKNIGKQIVRNMEPQGGGAYRGKVWRPSNDKIYVGKIALSGSNMSLAGCFVMHIEARLLSRT